MFPARRIEPVGFRNTLRNEAVNKVGGDVRDMQMGRRVFLGCGSYS
jgi:hypothetical protein